MRTMHWLKHYVLMRFIDQEQPRDRLQIGAFVKTVAVSALFHGFYIGYYIFFSGVLLLDLAWKLVGETALAVTVS